MKTIAITAAAVLVALSANSASAKQFRDSGTHGSTHSRQASKPFAGVGKLTRFERIKIRLKRAHVEALKARARADGHVTRHERIVIRTAERQLAALIRRERRD